MGHWHVASDGKVACVFMAYAGVATLCCHRDGAKVACVFTAYAGGAG